MIWSDIDFHPSERKLRSFAGLFFALATTLASWQAWAHDRWLTVALFLGAGTLVAAIGLLKPSAIRSIYIGMTVAAFPMGWVMSHVLLAIVYFGLFTPLAVLFRLTGRDALSLRSSPNVASYLKTRAKPPNSRSYFRPF